MSDEHLVQIALDILKQDPDYINDARIGAPLGNSVVGSVLNITTKSPRWATENAVIEALNRLDEDTD